MLGGSELEVGQTFSSKNKLINIVKRWHITHLLEYRVQQFNSIFVQLQCVQAPECKWYLRGGYYKRSDSFEIAKLKGSHICVLIFVKTNHYQFDANFITNAISTLVMNKLLIIIASL
jgi:hypothetical protein